MLGLATGLAEAGLRPFVYSIAPFATLRTYEFIRNGPILHRLPVRIVGMGGGFDYGVAGPTHHALDDIGALRVQPDLAIIAPADSAQTRTALRATHQLGCPIYYRLGKDDRLTVPGLEGRFRLGRAETIGAGDDVLLVTTGSITSEVVAAAHRLGGQGVTCTVLVVASISPAPEHDLVEALGRFPIALTVEAHSITGGLGSLVAEIIADHRLSCRLTRCGVRSGPDGVGGSVAFYHDLHGLSRDRLIETVLNTLQQVPVSL